MDSESPGDRKSSASRNKGRFPEMFQRILINQILLANFRPQ